MESTDLFLKIYNKKYNKFNTKKDITKWDWWGKSWSYIYPRVCKRTFELELIDENTPHYLFLLNQEHDIDIVTKSRAPYQDIKERLEELHIREGIEYNQLVQTEKKKIDLEYDLYIDDNPLMIEEFQTQNKKCLIVFDSPWNTNVQTGTHWTTMRMNKWSELFNMIEIVKNKYDKHDK